MLDLSERQVTRHTNTYHKRLHLYSGLKNHQGRLIKIDLVKRYSRRYYPTQRAFASL